MPKPITTRSLRYTQCAPTKENSMVNEGMIVLLCTASGRVHGLRIAMCGRAHSRDHDAENTLTLNSSTTKNDTPNIDALFIESCATYTGEAKFGGHIQIPCEPEPVSLKPMTCTRCAWPTLQSRSGSMRCCVFMKFECTIIIYQRSTRPGLPRLGR